MIGFRSKQSHELQGLLVEHLELPDQADGCFDAELFAKPTPRGRGVVLTGEQIRGDRGPPPIGVSGSCRRKALKQQIPVPIEDEDMRSSKILAPLQYCSTRDRADLVVVGVDYIDQGGRRRCWHDFSAEVGGTRISPHPSFLGHQWIPNLQVSWDGPFELLALVPVTENSFSSRLRRAMDSAGMSQRALAKATGVSKQSVTNWLGEVHEPRLSQVKRTADALGVSIGYLVGDDSTQSRPLSAADDLIERLGDLHASVAMRSLASQATDLMDLLSAAERLARQRRRTGGL